MIPSPSNPHELPYLMNLFSFFMASLVAILIIFQKIFTRSKLDIALTRDVFFRILENGESLYANVVLAAYDTGALIKNILANLTKVDASKKVFPLRVAQIGEKYRADDGDSKYYFSTTSPLCFVPENFPQRQIYLCEYASYADPTKNEFQQFQQNILQVKLKYPVPPDSNTDPTGFSQFKTDIDNVIQNTLSNIMDKIQIEAGRYILNLTIEYKQKEKYFPIFRDKKASSQIQFEIEDKARNYCKMQLLEYLKKRALQLLTGKFTEIIAIAPQYIPTNIVEVIKK
jgi:hypothetical protein